MQKLDAAVRADDKARDRRAQQIACHQHGVFGEIGKGRHGFDLEPARRRQDDRVDMVLSQGAPGGALVKLKLPRSSKALVASGVQLGKSFSFPASNTA